MSRRRSLFESAQESLTDAGQKPRPRFPVASTAERRLDCSDVDLSHPHHRIEGALGGRAIGTGERFRQGYRSNLPGQPPFILAPAAGALLATVADDCVPVTIRFS